MTVANPTTGIAPAVFSDARRPSRASTRSLQFGGFAVASNVMLAATSLGVLYFLADPAQSGAIAMLLDGVKFAVVGSLAGMAIWWGIRGLRETARGRTSRRGFAIAGIALGGLFGLLVATSFVATTVITLGA